MMSNDVHEEARRKIDAEILELQERIRSLRCARNTFSPIYSFPPEVVTQIFRWVQSLYCGRFEDSFRKATSLPKWVRVMHVSRHWRNVALNCQTLHSTIVTSNPEYCRQVLKLSGSSPLRIIDTSDGRPPSPEVLELILAALPRVRNLWIQSNVASLLLPHLEKFNLPLEEFGAWGCKDLKPTIFHRSLRCLQLTRSPCSSYEWLSRLSNLVDLKLEASPRNESIPMDKLLDILDRMQHLVTLRLSGIIRSAPTNLDREAPIRPQLQYLELEDLPGSVAGIFPWLSFAPRFRCTIKLTDFPKDSDWFTQISDQFLRHLASSPIVLRVAKLVWETKGYTGAAAILFSETRTEPCFELVFPPNPFRDALGIWWKVASLLPLGDIETLTVDAPCHSEDWDDGQWHKFPSLRRLVLRSAQASAGFLSYLLQRAGSPAFLSVEELSLSGVSDGKVRIQAGLIDRMMTPGVKLRRLAFYESVISDDMIKELSEVVEVVEKL